MRFLGVCATALCGALLFPHAASAQVKRIFPHINPVSASNLEHLAVGRAQTAEYEHLEYGVRNPGAPKNPSRYRARFMSSRQYTAMVAGRAEPVIDVDVIHRDANPVSGIEMTRQYTATYSRRTGALLALKAVPATAANAQKYGFPVDTFRHRIDTTTPSAVRVHR